MVRAEGSLSRLEGRFLLSVAGVPNLLGLRGPTATEEDAELGIVWLEWSNFLADVLATRSASWCRRVLRP